MLTRYHFNVAGETTAAELEARLALATRLSNKLDQINRIVIVPRAAEAHMPAAKRAMLKTRSTTSCNSVVAKERAPEFFRSPVALLGILRYQLIMTQPLLLVSHSADVA